MVIEASRDPTTLIRADISLSQSIAAMANAELSAIALFMAKDGVDGQILLPSELGNSVGVAKDIHI